MEDGAIPQAAGIPFWCKTCGQPVQLTGGGGIVPEYRKALHLATGTEEGPGGEGGSHIAVPTDLSPVLRAEADALREEFGAYVAVSLRFGLPRATWRPDRRPPGAADVPITAPNCQELRARLKTVIRP